LARLGSKQAPAISKAVKRERKGRFNPANNVFNVPPHVSSLIGQQPVIH
jgi:hypothetical protein